MHNYVKNDFKEKMQLLETKEKIHLGSLSIFFGLVFLFFGHGAYISIANNYFFFIIAIALNILSMLGFRQLNFEFSYSYFALGYFLVLTWIYQSIGQSDFSVSMSLILFIVLVFSCILLKYTQRDIDLIITGIVISGVIFSALLLFFGNEYSEAMFVKYTYTQVVGRTVELEPNFLGYWIFTGFLFSVYKLATQIEGKNRKKIIFYSLISIFTMIAMLRTGSRSALVSAIVFAICLIFLIKNKKIKFSILIVIIMMITALGLAIHFEIIPESIYNRLFKNSYIDGSNEKRLINWYYGLRAMIDTVFGAGPYATVNTLYTMYGYAADAHNTFITFGVYYGIPGFVIFSSFIIYLITQLWKYEKKIFVCIMISMIVQWNILACQFSFGLWMLILIAILTINVEKEKQRLIKEKENTRNEFL